MEAPSRRSRRRAAAPLRSAGRSCRRSEAPRGTSGAVFAFDVASRSWRRLPDLPTPRHGLGVVAAGGEVHVIGGGPEPGLTVTDANEALRL